MQQTLFKVKNLEKFIQKHGEDTFISQTISKMLDYKINKYYKEIKRLDKELKKFERTYKKESPVLNLLNIFISVETRRIMKPIAFTGRLLMGN